MLFYFVLILELALTFVAGVGLTVSCSDGGEVVFDLFETAFTSVPLYRLDRSFRSSSDQSCIGSIEIEGESNSPYQLVELGSVVFQKLPSVEIINIHNQHFTQSKREMYMDSPNIHTIDFSKNKIQELDSETQFPMGLRNLVLSDQLAFSKIKWDFFANHQNLTELDISRPLSVSDFTFEEGIFQNPNLSLVKIAMTSMPITDLKKSFLSNHAPSLTHVDMSRWKDLTSIEYNAFEDVVLDELNLSEWPMATVDADTFSGASIKKLILSRSKIEVLKSGSFSGLQDSQEINLSGSKITTIESGSFLNFSPSANFELQLPKEISCCDVEGLRELIGVSSGISINNNGQNYTCVTPDNTEKVVDILSNEDPALDLICCDYEKEYYNDTTKSCDLCMRDELCLEPSNACEGKKTSYLTCNKCNDGYNIINSFECIECTQSPHCIESSVECSLSPGNETVLKCNLCDVGFFPDPFSGLCTGCRRLSPSCITYDESCIVGTQNLACKTCNDDTQLIDGICGTVENSSLSLGASLGLCIGIIVLIALVSIICLLLCLNRRKKKKKKELFKNCGIVKKGSNIELYPVEFSETVEAPSDPNILSNSGYSNLEDYDSLNDLATTRLDSSTNTSHPVGQNCEDYVSGVRFYRTIATTDEVNDDEYLELGVQQVNSGHNAGQDSEDYVDIQTHSPIAKTSETNDDEYIQLGTQRANSEFVEYLEVDKKTNGYEQLGAQLSSTECDQQPSTVNENYASLDIQIEANLKSLTYSNNNELNVQDLPPSTPEKEEYLSVCIRDAGDNDRVPPSTPEKEEYISVCIRDASDNDRI